MPTRLVFPLCPTGDPWALPAVFVFPTGRTIRVDSHFRNQVVENLIDGVWVRDWDNSGSAHVKSCIGCGDWFWFDDARQGGCSEECVVNQRKSLQRRRIQPHNAKRNATAKAGREARLCQCCGSAMAAMSAKRSYCSPACRQRAYRLRSAQC